MIVEDVLSLLEVIYGYFKENCDVIENKADNSQKALLTYMNPENHIILSLTGTVLFRI